MSKDKPKRSRGWMITVLLASGALAYVLFAFLPGQVTVARMRSQLREQQQFVIQADRLISTIKMTEDELSSTEQFARQWQQQSPAESELPEVYGQISAAARESGVALLRFEPQPGVKLDTLTQVSATLVGQGSFSEVMSFVRQVEQLPVTKWISRLQIREGGEAGQELQCELTVAVFADNRGKSN